MSYVKISFEDSLVKEVVGTGKCLGCSTCVIVCPFNCLTYIAEKPQLIKECKVCGICAQTCPQYGWQQSKIESFVFGRERKPEEEFGVYRKLALTQATDSRVLGICQDGGAVTAILLFALKERIIDSAIVAGKEQKRPFYPRPTLATSEEEILQSAGTKYFYSPNILAIPEADKQKKSNVAFVGTPCQIRAIRKMQMTGLKKCVAPLKFLIGLACSECFTYEGLMENYIRGKLGINPNSIRKINIKGKIIVTLDSEIVTIPLAETKQYTRKSCHFCQDFSSELADISAGGLGLEGWTFVIMRTEKGAKLFSIAEKYGAIKVRDVNEKANALNLLNKLSIKKRKVLCSR